MSDLIVISEACRMLGGVSRVTLWRWGKNEPGLRPIKVGQNVARYTRQSISDYLTERNKIPK